MKFKGYYLYIIFTYLHMFIFGICFVGILAKHKLI